MSRFTRCLLTLCCSAIALPATSNAASLWIADDIQNMIYEVSLDGQLLTSFPQVRGGDSCIDVDFETDTLWSTAESKNRAVNFSKSGELPPACTNCVPEIDLGSFGAEDPEGVGVALGGDALWVADDPKSGAIPQIYKVALDGSLIASFETSLYDEFATSPQALAFDPFDKSLWVTDNRTDLIYHITQTGGLLGAISAYDYVGIHDPDVANANPQGISVDRSNGSLWVTDRSTSKIYNISSGRGGEAAGELLSFFESTTYDGSSLDPTGVAYDGPLGDLEPCSAEACYEEYFQCRSDRRDRLSACWYQFRKDVWACYGHYPDWYAMKACWVDAYHDLFACAKRCEEPNCGGQLEQCLDECRSSDGDEYDRGY